MSRAMLRLLTLSLSLCCAKGAWAQIVIDGQIDAAYGMPIASDPAGDYVGNAEWDLLKLYLTHDATNLYVAFSVGGDIVKNAGGKYIFYIDTTADGAGATVDAWARKVTVSGKHKPELSINTWVNSPPYGPNHTELWRWGTSSWLKKGTVDAAALKKGARDSVIEWRIPLIALGNPKRIWVEVFSSGENAGDNAQDTINAPADDWNAPKGAGQWSTPATLSCSTLYDMSAPRVDGGVPADAQALDSRLADSAATLPDAALADANMAADTRAADTRAADAAVAGDSRISDDKGAEAAAAGDGAAADASIRDGAIASGGDAGGDGAGGDGAITRPRQDEGCGCGASASGSSSLALSLPLLAMFLFGRRRRGALYPGRRRRGRGFSGPR